MSNYKLIFGTSPTYIVLFALLSTFIGLILYYKNQFFKGKIAFILSLLRFISVFLVLVLILGLVIKNTFTFFEKPVFAIAIDNSESLSEVGKSGLDKEKLNQLSKLGSVLEENGFEVFISDLKKNQKTIEDIKINEKTSDLDALLKNTIDQTHGKYLDEILLVSDGLFNKGLNPVYSNNTFRLNTLGLGDTIERKDIKVSAIYYNKIGFLGNKLPLKAEIQCFGYSNQNILVNLKSGGNIIEKKSINLKGNGIPVEVDFLIQPKNKGIQQFEIAVSPMPEEQTDKNNSKTAIIEIIDGKEKILIAASAPHPDIKAVRASLEQADNLEVSLFIPGISEFKNEKYDLIILHQIPDLNSNVQSLLEDQIKKGTPVLYILGTNSNVFRFNQLNSNVFIQARGNSDLVSAEFNEAFSRFKFDNNLKQRIGEFPPLQVPFGEISMKGNTETVLFQTIGNTNLQKPLFTCQINENSRSGVWLGEGFWQWRLFEYEKYGEQTCCNQMFQKIVQLLSAKDDKRRFRFFPVYNEILQGESFSFQAETYNQLFEKAYDKEISLVIKSDKKAERKFSFINSESNSTFQIDDLAPGVYTYTASALLDGKLESASGKFSVAPIELEHVNLKADHKLLKELSAKTNGQYFNSIEKLESYIKTKKAKTIAKSSIDFQDLINQKWIFGLILLAISLEWFIRKYKGEL